MARELDAASFDRLLAIPTYYEGLRDFMIKEFSEESLLFWTVCDEFSKLSANDHSVLQRDAQKIFSMYLSSASVFAIQVPPTEIKTIFEAIRNSTVTNALFNKSKQEVAADILKNVFPRFTTNPTFRHLRNNEDGSLFRNAGSGGPLKVELKDPVVAIKQSTTLQRSFNLAAIAAKTGTSFVRDFYEELFRLSPEARLVFQNKIGAQQGLALQGALKHLLAFTKESEKSYKSQIRNLADIHLRMGTTTQMFEHFGVALISTSLNHLQLEPDSPEYRALDRRWRAVYALLSAEIVKAMTSPHTKSVFFTKKHEVPQWLSDQLLEYKTFASLTMMLVKSKLGDERFMVLVYNGFFELSPTSLQRFKNLTAQRVALWGALNSVIRLLEQPTKMRSVMASLAKTHKSRGITKFEYHCLIRAVRQTFKRHLGSDYSESMDAVWKQFLELLTMFMVESIDTDAGLPSLSFAALDPSADIKETTEKEQGVERSRSQRAANAYNAINELDDITVHSTTRIDDEDKSHSSCSGSSSSGTSSSSSGGTSSSISSSGNGSSHSNSGSGHGHNSSLPNARSFLVEIDFLPISTTSSDPLIFPSNSNLNNYQNYSNFSHTCGNEGTKSHSDNSTSSNHSYTSADHTLLLSRSRVDSLSSGSERDENFSNSGSIASFQSFSDAGEDDQKSLVPPSPPLPPPNPPPTPPEWDIPATRTRSKRLASKADENKLLDLAFFKKRMPGVPDAVLLTQIQKLNEQLVYSTKQLENFSLAEVETIVAPVTARILKKYTRHKSKTEK